MKNIKGFTLLEQLALVSIFCIIAVIAISHFTKNSEADKKNKPTEKTVTLEPVSHFKLTRGGALSYYQLGNGTACIVYEFGNSGGVHCNL